MLAAKYQSRIHELGCFQHIQLDQCIWGIVSANAAAEELLEIDQRFASRTTDTEPALAPFWESIQAGVRKAARVPGAIWAVANFQDAGWSLQDDGASRPCAESHRRRRSDRLHLRTTGSVSPRSQRPDG